MSGAAKSIKVLGRSGTIGRSQPWLFSVFLLFKGGLLMTHTDTESLSQALKVHRRLSVAFPCYVLIQGIFVCKTKFINMFA